MAYEELLAEMENGTKHLIIDGSAGSGKTELIKTFLNRKKRKVIGCATTGLAGSHISGTTVHAVFGFPLRLVIPGDPNRKRRDLDLLTHADTLLIDEVSMLSCSMLDAIDHDLRALRDSHQPFGGMRLILVGDHYQISPVVKDSHRDELMALSPHYREPFYYFQSAVFQQKGFLARLKLFVLGRSFRQSGDTNYKEILDRMRVGGLTDGDLAILNEMYGLPPSTFDAPSICMRKDEVKYANIVALRANPLREWAIQPVPASVMTTGDLAFKMHPASEVIRLRVNARVMITRNNHREGYYNGTTGRVSDIITNKTGDVARVVVCTNTGEQIEVAREPFAIYRSVFDRTTDTVESVQVGEIHNFPITLAYAMTAHKAQGLTLDRVAVCRGMGVFTPGQMYTALSRVRKLDDLVLTHRIRREDCFASPAVAQFMAAMAPRTKHVI